MGISCECEFNDDPSIHDIKNAHEYRFNVTVGSEHLPLSLYEIPGAIHTKGGKYGVNSYYVADREIDKGDLKPGKLTPYNGEVCWGYTVNQINWYSRDELRNTTKATITCGGEQVYQLIGDWDTITIRVLDTIVKLKEHVLYIGHYDYENNVVGRKIWWRDEPATIIEYYKKSGEILIVCDNKCGTFRTLNREDTRYDKENPKQTYGGSSVVKDNILSNDIYWFRD